MTQCLTLADACVGDQVVVRSVRGNLRIEEMGIVPGAVLTMVRKIPGSAVQIAFDSTLLALSYALASSIILES